MNTDSVAAQGVNDFTITDYHIDYYLGRDTDSRSTLKTVERITADFPVSDANHGLERSVPKSYDGHQTSLKIETVVDENGAAQEYATREENGNKVLRIGSADRYVHGPHTYVITYTQRDVTRYFADTKRDEFYWDTNGTDWRVPISLLRVRLHLEQGLQTIEGTLPACYFGVAGSTGRCAVSPIDDGYAASATNLLAGQNITLAAGFQPGTFGAYQKSLGEQLQQMWVISQVVTAIVAAPLLLWLNIRYKRISNRTGEITTIVPEYLPPKDTSITVAGSIAQKAGPVFSAQLLDLAIRGYLRIYQTRPKSFFRKAQYEIEIISDIASLHDEEQEILRDIFPATTVGTRLSLEQLRKQPMQVAKNFQDNDKKLEANLRGAYAIRSRDPVATAWFRRVGKICAVLAVPTLSIPLIVVAAGAFILSYVLWPLTDKGLALSRYLEGMKLYIKTAEMDRIRMLQSPEGAEKIGMPIDTNDNSLMVKLYERMLPYAVLFRLEKDWNQNLGQYYERLGQSPDWYSGNGTAFNAAVLSASLSDFNSAANYSVASSSSSGGSSGGGSSGGGGGGGGGGGW
jgi:uncharacterized membrane protein YgcG